LISNEVVNPLKPRGIPLKHPHSAIINLIVLNWKCWYE